MRKRYNRTTTTDIPMEETSFTSLVEHYDKQRTKSNRKIKAIGKKASDNLNVKSYEFEDVTKKSRYGVNKYAEGLNDLKGFKEDQTIRNHKSKSMRNVVIIILLLVSLIAAVGIVSTYVVISKLETNCYMHVDGGRANYIINGMKINEFRSPSGIEGNRILKVEIKLEIKEFGKFRIKYTPKCYKGEEELENVLIYGCNFDLFYEGGDGYWYSNEEIKGGQTILLCRGIILDDNYNGNLDVKNFKLDFYTYLEKV